MLRPLLLAAALTLPHVASAQTASPPNTVPVVPNAPTDRPVNVGPELPDATLAQLDHRIAPAVRQARKTLPQAKRRYLAGLPAGQAFFLSTRLRDPDGLVEQVFVRVTEWRGTQVKGTIANELGIVKTDQQNQLISFPDSAVLDWTISRPDGSEEGNYVGKLLDAGAQ